MGGISIKTILIRINPERLNERDGVVLDFSFGSLWIRIQNAIVPFTLQSLQ